MVSSFHLSVSGNQGFPDVNPNGAVGTTVLSNQSAIAKQGAAVHILELNAEAAEATADEIKNTGGTAYAHACLRPRLLTILYHHIRFTGMKLRTTKA